MFLTASQFIQKCRDPGSNRGPPDLQSDALPTELSRLSQNLTLDSQRPTDPIGHRHLISEHPRVPLSLPCFKPVIVHARANCCKTHSTFCSNASTDVTRRPRCISHSQSARWLGRMYAHAALATPETRLPRSLSRCFGTFWKDTGAVCQHS